MMLSMSLPQNPIIIIPARMQSRRLPGKPLADIAGLPMIVQVMKRAEEAAIGPVVVAAAEREIAQAVEAAGGRAVLTGADHPSGSDRVWEALKFVDPQGEHDAVINLQGDLPTIGPSVIRAVLKPLARAAVDIATLVAEITDDAERGDPSVVKAALSIGPGEDSGRALYFSRAPVPSSGPLYHHIGIYAFRPQTLRRFVSLPAGGLEKVERLEQLRALEDGMRIDAARVDTVPLGVDTPADLERAREILSAR
jgi:3-deoxy-manno-octulosonate cytidylyltransferase (CMP-KDO synthetase)